MFVDIVSFSQISAPLPSRKVFNELSRRISQIGSVVEAHGGTVDRSLGDGLLCFFGSEDADEPEKNTMNAFLAACKIQELTVSQANSAAASGRDVMIMPVRIGIHSAEVSVGNLGGQTLVDFTMVGSGVNFARRLQTACSPFKMIVSKLCRDQLVKGGVSPSLFSDIAIAVKHHANLVQACECDPFYERPHLLKVAETFHLDQLGVRAFDKSVDVEDPSAINLVSSYGTFVVVDLSMFGFRVTGPRLFGQKSLISVKIVTSDVELNRKLQEKLMDGVTVEVRWGKAIRSGFEHGLKIYGGNKGQRQFLYDLLRERYGAPRNNRAADQIIRDIA
jgi:class 3 adenylate cyclase